VCFKFLLLAESSYWKTIFKGLKCPYSNVSLSCYALVFTTTLCQLKPIPACSRQRSQDTMYWLPFYNDFFDLSVFIRWAGPYKATSFISLSFMRKEMKWMAAACTESLKGGSTHFLVTQNALWPVEWSTSSWLERVLYSRWDLTLSSRGWRIRVGLESKLQ